MGMENQRLDFLKGYYYLAPVWLLVESLFWPGLRAGLVVGNSEAGAILFYAVEGAIGAAFWFGLRGANVAAFVENLVYLVFGFKYLLFSHLDIASDVESVQIAPHVESYIHSLPGVVWSMMLVVLQVYRQGILRLGSQNVSKKFPD